MHNAQFQRLLRANRLALQQHGQRGGNADQARQALGAAAARQQADFRFRQADLNGRIIGADPVMAAQRNFQPAAQRNAVNRSRHRLAAGFQFAQEAAKADDRAGIKRLDPLFMAFLAVIGGDILHQHQIGARQK